MIASLRMRYGGLDVTAFKLIQYTDRRRISDSFYFQIFISFRFD